MKNKVGIICAVDREAAPFISFIEDYEISEKAMLKFYSGKIGDIPVVTLFCGVCKTNAAIATQILIDTYGCNIIINAGTAGGMDTKIKLLDTVISTESSYWDISEGILMEYHPKLESVYFKADKDLLDLVKQIVVKNVSEGKIHFGRMITGEAFIEDKYRDEINAHFSPLSVDMETASIAHVCYVNKIPYISIRTITDTAEHSGKQEFDLNCGKASQISANIVTAILNEMR